MFLSPQGQRARDARPGTLFEWESERCELAHTRTHTHRRRRTHAAAPRTPGGAASRCGSRPGSGSYVTFLSQPPFPFSCLCVLGVVTPLLAEQRRVNKTRASRRLAVRQAAGARRERAVSVIYGEEPAAPGSLHPAVSPQTRRPVSSPTCPPAHLSAGSFRLFFSPRCPQTCVCLRRGTPF